MGLQLQADQPRTRQGALDWTLNRSYVGTPFEAFRDLPEGLHIAVEGGPADQPATSLRDLVQRLQTLYIFCRLVLQHEAIQQAVLKCLRAGHGRCCRAQRGEKGIQHAPAESAVVRAG